MSAAARPDGLEGPTRRCPRALLVATALAIVARALAGVHEVSNPPQLTDRVAWVDASHAPAVSRATGKPLLYEFTADWCPPCRKLSRDVLADPVAARWIADRFVPVKVREEAHDARSDELRARFGVASYPTVVVLAPGDERPRVFRGYAGKRRWLEQLEAAHARSASPAR